MNIASIGGVAGLPGVATYCATKFGVVGLMDQAHPGCLSRPRYRRR
ncbi:MAG TPA: hypothetical protein VGI49_08480 [Mycobacterium sp.]